MIFDTHIHTAISPCSRLDVHELVEAAGRIGLDGICVTDHESMAISRYITEGRQPNGLVVIIGMEYETPEGDFLLFGPAEQIPSHLSAPELLNYTRSAGGVAIAAHPCRKERPVRESIFQKGLCPVIETHNGRNTIVENLKASKRQTHYGLIATAGSDAHTADELGTAVTRFSAPICSRQDFIQALKRGQCQPAGSYFADTARSNLS
ncbi:MAG: PHP domain-containing protein [Desulfobacterales bacterium]|nr:PHP domain-containing protein [Desulfobacterales bacterium]